MKAQNKQIFKKMYSDFFSTPPQELNNCNDYWYVEIAGITDIDDRHFLHQRRRELHTILKYDKYPEA